MSTPDLELDRRFLKKNPPPGRVLCCAVTGSHHYGFSSPDSDLDLKGIHLCPTEVLLGLSPEGYVACCAAVRDMDQRESIARIAAPTMVIAGTHDAATPPAAGQFIAKQIPGARYVELDAAHISNVEAADRFTESVLGFVGE